MTTQADKFLSACLWVSSQPRRKAQRPSFPTQGQSVYGMGRKTSALIIEWIREQRRWQWAPNVQHPIPAQLQEAAA